MNVRGQNACSALIPMSLPAGKEKHHDSRSQRLKHQLATVNEASLASAKFPPLFCSHSFAPTSFLHSHFTITAQINPEWPQTPVKEKAHFHWNVTSRDQSPGTLPGVKVLEGILSKLACWCIKSGRVGHFLRMQWVFKNAGCVKFWAVFVQSATFSAAGQIL